MAPNRFVDHIAIIVNLAHKFITIQFVCCNRNANRLVNKTAKHVDFTSNDLYFLYNE